MTVDIGWHGWLTIAVVLATICALLWERFSPDKIMAAAAGILLCSGILTPQQALAGFWNPGVLTVALLFVLMAALKTTGAIRWIGDWVLGRPAGEFRAQTRLVVIAAPLSAFINNTPIVSMLTSAVDHWTRKTDVSPSKLLMPMNYATILGGMCTLVGTSTNLIVAGLVLKVDTLAPLTMFTPLAVGAVAAVSGALYLLTVGRWLLPARRSSLQQATDTREYLVEMLVERDGQVVGKTVSEARLRHLAGSYLLELIREGQVFAAVGPDMLLQAEDRLVFVGRTDAVRELRRVPGLRPATEQVFKLDGAEGQRTLVEVVLSGFNPAVGKTLASSRFRGLYNAAAIAVSHHGQRVPEKLGEIVLQAGDTLLVETDPQFLARHGSSPDFLLVNKIDGAARVDRRGALTSLFILAAMIVSNAVLGVDILFSALMAAILAVLAGCVSPAELRRSFDLRLLVVIASSFALGAAIEQSGVASLIATALQHWSTADPFWTLVLVYVMTVVSTEMLTNNAAAVLMFPIALASAEQLGVNPMPFVMAIMMGASAGFITPIGYQTNLMIYGPGGYRFADFIRVGAPLSLIVGCAVLYAIPLLWPF